MKDLRSENTGLQRQRALRGSPEHRDRGAGGAKAGRRMPVISAVCTVIYAVPGR